MARKSPAISGDKETLASDVWRRLFDFFIYTTRPQRDVVLADLGLTPNDSKALFSLDRMQPRTMKSLAAAWKCDASTATWTVDRLERMGLAERRADPSDRRVRHVVLTERGAATYEQLLERMYATPPELLRLSAEQLESLRAIVDSLPQPPTR